MINEARNGVCLTTKVSGCLPGKPRRPRCPLCRYYTFCKCYEFDRLKSSTLVHLAGRAWHETCVTEKPANNPTTCRFVQPRPPRRLRRCSTGLCCFEATVNLFARIGCHAGSADPPRKLRRSSTDPPRNYYQELLSTRPALPPGQSGRATRAKKKTPAMPRHSGPS